MKLCPYCDNVEIEDNEEMCNACQDEQEGIMTCPDCLSEYRKDEFSECPQCRYEKMKERYEYIYFEEEPNPGKKTKQFWCRNKKSDITLGVIRWHSPWRQYCFLPTGPTIFSRGCLKDIVDFINQLMEERKK